MKCPQAVPWLLLLVLSACSPAPPTHYSTGSQMILRWQKGQLAANAGGSWCTPVTVPEDTLEVIASPSSQGSNWYWVVTGSGSILAGGCGVRGSEVRLGPVKKVNTKLGPIFCATFVAPGNLFVITKDGQCCRWIVSWGGPVGFRLADSRPIRSPSPDMRLEASADGRTVAVIQGEESQVLVFPE